MSTCDVENLSTPILEVRSQHICRLHAIPFGPEVEGVAVSEMLSEEEAVAAVSSYLAAVQKRRKVRLRVHTIGVPGHIDFSTPSVRGRIILSQASVTSTAIRRTISALTRGSSDGKTVMVFTTGTFAGDPRDFAFWPLFHIDLGGSVRPWNRRAKRFRRTLETEANRGAAVGYLLPAVILGVLSFVVIGRTGWISGPAGIVVSIIGLAILVVGAGLISKGPAGVLGGLIQLTRGLVWIVRLPVKFDSWRRRREVARWQRQGST